MTELKTTYLGIEFKHPVLASSSPLSKKLENFKRLEEAGVAGVVMYSLFEEQIEHESKALNYYLDRGTESFAEALTYFPEMDDYNVGPDSYLDLIRQAKESVDMPIIGSLNGHTRGGWIQYAKMIEDAGADAIELNIYFIPTDFRKTSAQLEQEYIELIKAIRAEIGIPLTVKLGPYFTSLPQFCYQLVGIGVDGFVFFNRFYQPDLDIENMEVVPNLELSKSSDLRLPLRWIAMLYGRVTADFSLTSGVHRGEDVIKSLMAGAKTVQVASELLEYGVKRAGTLVSSMETWMQMHNYESVTEMIGSMSQMNVAEPGAFERANYMKALSSMDRENFY
jgi:dihydroorotate dehydrogenase (fumarate)